MATDDHERDKIDNVAHSIVEGIAQMLKLFQEGVVPEKIPDLMLSINEKFLKSLGDPEDMRRQMARFEKVRTRFIFSGPNIYNHCIIMFFPRAFFVFLEAFCLLINFVNHPFKILATLSW